MPRILSTASSTASVLLHNKYILHMPDLCTCLSIDSSLTVYVGSNSARHMKRERVAYRRQDRFNAAACWWLPRGEWKIPLI